MPLQYKTEYRLEDKPQDVQVAKKRGTRSFHRPGPAAMSKDRPTKRPPDSVDKNSPRRSSTKAEAGGGKERKTAKGLDKVVLPAGYCVYYARGHGGSLVPADLGTQQGKTTRCSQKGLGSVCSSHNVLEEEYAIIREVVEMYLERQVCVGMEGSKYRPGGQLQDQKQLLEELVLALPDIEETTAETSLVPYEELPTNAEADSSALDTPKSSPCTARSTCLLPISKALQANLSPRGPFLVAGQALKDSARDVDIDGKEGEKLSKEYKALADDPETLGGGSVALRVVGEKKGQETYRFYSGPLHIVSHGHPDLRPDRSKRKVNVSRSVRHFISHGPRHIPLGVVSDSVHVEVHDRNSTVVPKNPAAIDVQPAVTARPPSPTLRESVKQTTARGRPKYRRPLKPYRGHESDTMTSSKAKHLEGRSIVTKMPSKVILDVVLPREDKSREDRLCSRQRSLSGSLRAWLSSTVCSPPPPPPSALADPDAECVVLPHHDPGDSEEDLTESTQSRAGSSVSCSSHPSYVAGSRSLKVAGVKSTDTVSRYSDNGSFSDRSVNAARPAHGSATAPGSTDAPTTYSNVQVLSSSLSSSPVLSTERGSVSVMAKAAGPELAAADTGETATERISPKEKQQLKTSCHRAAHCDVLGPDLCADCEAAQHRQQFAARQEILYPRIAVTPRHMVAPHKVQDQTLAHSDCYRGHNWPGTASSSYWPYMSLAQLNDVVTDLDLCRRIAEKGHRSPRRPPKFS